MHILQMPRSCCVPGCKANYSSSDVSAFLFPVDEARQQKWVKAIHRSNFTPTKNTVVCARHFEDHFIIREDRMTRPDGTVIIAKRGKLGSDKGCLPNNFFFFL